jgi:hypothetical protein
MKIDAWLIKHMAYPFWLLYDRQPSGLCWGETTGPTPQKGHGGVSYFRDSVSLELEEVASVSREASGKCRFVINDAEGRHADDGRGVGYELERTHAAD